MKNKLQLLVTVIFVFQLYFLTRTEASSTQQNDYTEQCTSNERKCSLQSLHDSLCTGDCHAIALIGNPGTGKSTILNGLVGTPVFRSGYSFGTGLTTKLHEHKVGKISFFDTPGLNDISTRQQAGHELNELLRQNINIKIAFVITLQSGRINVEDVTTMGLVLDAISVDTTDRFGIIVNKLTEKEHSNLTADALQRFKLKALITNNKRNTSHWCFLQEDEKLKNAENGMLHSNGVVKLFAQLTVTKGESVKVEDIDTDTYDEKLDELKKEHEQKMKQIELMAKVVGLIAAGTVTLNVITSHGWLLKYCHDISSVAWISQQLPVVLRKLNDSGQIDLANIRSTAQNATMSFQTWAKQGFSKMTEAASKIDARKNKFINSLHVRQTASEIRSNLRNRFPRIKKSMQGRFRRK